MSDDIDPVKSIQDQARVQLPRRFYRQAVAAERDGAYALLLDDRPAKTPAKRALAVASKTIAEAIAGEWEAQAERIDPATMPVTRIVNVAIDRIVENAAAVRAEILAYAASDLLCYRAEGPKSLIALEDSAWSPLLAWARETLGARFILAEGVVHAAQDPGTLAAVERSLSGYDGLALAALHTITTLTGSAVIALAVARGRLSAEAAWAAAHVDEDWQMSQWGVDHAAMQRRAARWREMAAASLILGALAA